MRLGASRVAGIACGVGGALGSAWAAYSLRMFLTRSKGLPDVGLALAEDALAAWAARLVTKAE